MSVACRAASVGQPDDGLASLNEIFSRLPTASAVNFHRNGPDRKSFLVTVGHAIIAAFPMATHAYDLSQVFVELGLVILGLAILARFANRAGFLRFLSIFWRVSHLAMEDYFHSESARDLHILAQRSACCCCSLC